MISIENVQQAAKMIKGTVIKTPLVYSPSLSKMFEGEIYLKLENLQKTGSFKIRGATYYILTHKDEIGHGGVVAASAGNHAQGVSFRQPSSCLNGPPSQSKKLHADMAARS